jgi:hypothetical protein
MICRDPLPPPVGSNGQTLAGAQREGRLRDRKDAIVAVSGNSVRGPCFFRKIRRQEKAQASSKIFSLRLFILYTHSRHLPGHCCYPYT